MGNKKVFAVTTATEVEAEPLEFEIQVTNAAGERAIHEFTVAGPPLSTPAAMALGSIQRWNAAGQREVDLNGVTTFLARVMPAADFGRFMGLVEDPDVRMEMDTIAAVFRWLVEEYTGRPTRPSSSSSNGRRPTGRNSTAEHSSAAAT